MSRGPVRIASSMTRATLLRESIGRRLSRRFVAARDPPRPRSSDRGLDPGGGWPRRHYCKDTPRAQSGLSQGALVHGVRIGLRQPQSCQIGGLPGQLLTYHNYCVSGLVQSGLSRAGDLWVSLNFRGRATIR
jgi:hypothetical protein